MTLGKEKSRYVKELLREENLIVVKGPNHGFSEGCFVYLDRAENPKNEGWYRVLSKRGTKIHLDPSYNNLWADQPAKSTRRRTLLTEPSYKYMPESKEVGNTIREMIEAYDQKRKLVGGSFSPLPENIRRSKHWNSFYELYYFLKEFPQINPPIYIKIIFEEFSTLKSSLKLPSPPQFKALKYLYDRRVKSGSLPSKSLSMSDHIRKQIGRDILNFKKTQVNLEEIHKKSVTEAQVVSKFYTSFSPHFILTNDIVSEVITKKLKTIGDLFPTKSEEMEDAYKLLTSNRKLKEEIYEYRKQLFRYLNDQIQEHINYFYSNPHGVLNHIKQNLEEINFKVTSE